MATTIKKVTLKSLRDNTPIDPTKGTVTNPYTQDEYYSESQAGTWQGGYVEAMGYIGIESIWLPTVVIYGDEYTGRHALASIANKYVGINVGDNPDVIEGWMSAVGQSGTTNWCAAFVSAVYREAGVSGVNSALVSAWASWGNATSEPQIGDVVIYPQNYSHVGIIVDINESMLEVVSGNSDDTSENSNGTRAVTSKPFHKNYFSTIRTAPTWF